MPEVAIVDRRSSWPHSTVRDRASGARPGWADVHALPAGPDGAGRRGAMRLVRPRPAVSGADLELLALLATGMPAPRVARTLAVSDRTIRRRVRSICELIGVDTAIEAVAWAARRQLI
ncbi:hypothetical protein [Jiangella alba]|uniref:HTH luxR-type domain-containing protein n=1 Tax=Jiangella alba TaxID=561176 RepID=A0A1H5PYJ8_9ACTN|nr:hypothetical protein [Jiangella alba]SEF18942.1 hypothetical protein SAMN04488561_7013 [Jiangella alba]